MEDSDSLSDNGAGTGTPPGKLGSGHGTGELGLEEGGHPRQGWAPAMARSRRRDEDTAGDDGVVRRSAHAQSATGEPALTERTQGLNVVHVYVSDNGSIYGRSVENGMDR